MEEEYSKYIQTSFKNDIMREMIRSNLTNSKVKITDEAIELVNELMTVLLMETTLRTSRQAKTEERSLVTLDHVEMILPQIMLDFP